MKFIWRYLKKNSSKLVIATVMSALSGLGITFIMKSFHQSIKNDIADPSQLFLYVAAGLTAFSVFGILSEKILSKVLSDSILNMRIDFCQLIFKTEYVEVESKKQELFSSLVTDINGLARIIEKLPGANTNFVISLAGIIYLITISWQMAMVMVGFFGVTYLIIIRRNTSAYKLTMQARKSWDSVYHVVHDIIYGLKELSLDSDQKETFIDSQLKIEGQKEANQKVAVRLFNQVTGKISETVMILGICTMIVLTLLLDDISLASFAEFLTISLFIVAPLASVSNFTKEMVPLRVLANHIQEIGIRLEKNQDDVSQDRVEITETNQPIVFDSVQYKYLHAGNDHHFHLGPFSFEIPANKITLIYGTNGSGKTTLSKILAGLYKPSEGQVRYGNTLLERNTLQSFRDKISAVFTDNHLFRFNHISDQNKPKFKELLQLFSIEKSVEIDGNTIITSGLSTGQGKRLALVLAMLADREIYIFDEWAANQDPQFKQVFYYELIPQLKKEGKTVVLITHDDQYFEIADHKVHLREGRVV